MIAITGTGRCGTMYAAEYFSMVFNFDVKHESFGKDGISSLHLGSQKWKDLLYHNSYGYKCYIFHQVRHPLKVISSLVNRDIIGVAAEVIPQIKSDDHPLIRSAKYFYYWNRRLESMYNFDMRYHVEGMHQKLFVKHLCRILGIEYTPSMYVKANNINKEINTGYMFTSAKNTTPASKLYKKRYQLSDIERLDAETAELIYHMSIQYGYTL